MKKLMIFLLLLALVGPAFTEPSDVIYTEGEARIKEKAGDEFEAEIGDQVNIGDTVFTGFDGLVELDRGGITLTVNPDTVFTLMEKEVQKEKSDVFSVVLGAIKFRYLRLVGKEPLIQTPTAVAGVRGTEFTVFAGVDGSSLIVVESGLVEVSAAGETVALNPDEGVEIQPGQAPGEKFSVQRDQIDYRTWNEQKLEALLKNPIRAMIQLNQRLGFYIDNVEEYLALYKEYRGQFEAALREQKDIRSNTGEAAARKFYDETINPLAIEAGNLFVNLRYFSLAALSLRRYVVGRVYLNLKSKYIAELMSEQYKDEVNRFMNVYNRFLTRFEDSIVPHLVREDI